MEIAARTEVAADQGIALVGAAVGDDGAVVIQQVEQREVEVLRQRIEFAAGGDDIGLPEQPFAPHREAGAVVGRHAGHARHRQELLQRPLAGQRDRQGFELAEGGRQRLDQAAQTHRAAHPDIIVIPALGAFGELPRGNCHQRRPAQPQQREAAPHQCCVGGKLRHLHVLDRPPRKAACRRSAGKAGHIAVPPPADMLAGDCNGF